MSVSCTCPHSAGTALLQRVGEALGDSWGTDVGLELRMLGPFELRDTGRAVGLTAHKPRALLAMLAVHAGEFVRWHVLLDELWEGDPPRSAIANLRTYAAELRRCVFGSGDQLTADASGYRLRLDHVLVDLTEFDRLCAQAREQHRSAELQPADHTYQRALALWRGPALGGLPHGPVLAATATALEERRIGVIEEAYDVRLDLLASGQCSGPDLVADLRRQVAAHPLRERLWRQLVVALYRLGDVASALAACADARRTLRERLGLDPDNKLEWLHSAVLRRDPELLRPGVQDLRANTAQRNLARTRAAAPQVAPRVGAVARTHRRPPQVAVCGPARCTDAEARHAKRLGRLLAGRGAVVLCSGSPDTIGAVATGAQQEGGMVIGLAPESQLDDPETRLSAMIATTMSQTGLATLVCSADAVITVGSSWATLSIIAMAVDRGEVPVVALGGWTVLDRAGLPVPGIHVADTPDSAVDLALDAVG